MKVELEITDIKETVSALNNAIIAYQDVYSKIYVGCEIPYRFESFLRKYSYDEQIKLLAKRLDILKDIYLHLLNIEASVDEPSIKDGSETDVERNKNEESE